MKTRMVILGALWLASALAADEPAKTTTSMPKPAPETQAQLAAKLETDAKTFGVTVAELKRLRRENNELRRANEILKAASAFFARELDPRLPHS